MDTVAIGIDLGATKIAAALVTGTGQILTTRHTLTAAHEGPDQVLDRIAALANDLISEVSTQPFKLLGIGIGSPGLVDPHAGIVYNAVNLGWQAVHLVDELHYRLKLPLPVWVQKDGNASAIGEYIFGAARNVPDFTYLSIGTGLGGGLMAGGQLIIGANWYATELGHISLDPHGRDCVCGLKGCAETVISGHGLIALFKTLRKIKAAGNDLLSNDIDPSDIVQAARTQDALAVAALAEMGRHLGMVIAFCAAVTNPSLVVIGGGLGLAAFDLILPSARIELETRVLRASHVDLQIVPSQQKSSAVGAASLAWYFTKKEVTQSNQRSKEVFN